MKFYGTPNMLVRIKNLKPFRSIRFDDKGEFETDNPRLAARLKTRFEVKTEPKTEQKAEQEHKCKKCDYKTDNKGELLAHYRTEHPKK